MSKPNNTALIVALSARIIEMECRIEALTASMKLYADPQDLATQRGIEAHTLSLLKIRRHDILANH
jgi:hypothetical protein